MEYRGFIDGAGALSSLSANVERTVNLFLELVDGGTGKNKAWLRPTPGMSLFTTIAGGEPVRTVFHHDGRCFAVSGSSFVEIASDGTVTPRGTVLSDSRPVSIFSNGAIGRQLFIVSAMAGYIFALDTNVFTTIGGGFPAACLTGTFADSYFLALYSGTPKFGFSSLADGLTWDALDVAQKSQTSDNLLTMVYDHKDLWLFGTENTEIWTNSGDARNPWTPQPILITTGIAGSDAWVQADDSIYWIGSGKDGARTVLRAQGFAPQRVSTHSLEEALKGYSRVDDAIGWSYEDAGHVTIVFTFPTAGATWRYAAQTQTWSEWLYWDTASGAYQAHLGRCHAYAFEKHLVGSRVDGKIYQLSSTVYTDNGAAIRRLRRAPHVHNENKRVFHHRLELDMRTGVGLASGQGSDPQMFMRYSNDGGHTWSSEEWASLGPYQAYERRVFWQRLGQARNRVYEVVTSDPVFVGIINAYLDVEGGLH